jgi:hypothetical protein
MTQATVYEYPVRRSFQYNGEQYNPGDWWTPGGFKNDKNIIKFFVNSQFAQIKQEPAPKKTTRRRKPTGKKGNDDN